MDHGLYGLRAVMPSIPKPFTSANGHAAVTLEDCYLLMRQLHVLQKSGVPLLSSLSALQSQMPSPILQRILRDVHRDLLEGRTFSQALGRHPRAFGPIVVGMVRVGEAGGLLSEVLEQLAKLFEWEIELRHRLREALTYPAIVLVTLSIAIGIMLVFVLPRFSEMFRSFRIDLPFQTRLLIAVSDLLAHYGWLIALLAAGAAAGWWAYLHTEGGRLRWHAVKLKLPVVGPIFLQLSMSRFARITAALTHSGVPMIETLALAAGSVNNRYVRQRLDRIRAKVVGGESVAGAMKADALFPPVVMQMVATGEETGRLDELLQSVSEYYDQQVNYAVRRLITYIEPALLLVVGCGVLLMATAVFVPMWDLVQMFKQGR